MTYHKGFTLLEMAMVLLIVSILISSLLIPINSQLQLRRIAETERKLNQIKQSIMSYIVLEQTLPCPDTDDDGVENVITNDRCSAREGTVPWRSLGLSAGQNDGWGQAFAYAIAYGNYQNKDRTATDKIMTLTNLTAATGLNIQLDSTSNLIKDSALLIVYSMGADATAYSENANGNNTYKYGDYVENIYDDHLVWLSRYEIVSYINGYSY